MRDHRKLRAFQLADGLVMQVYRNSRRFPGEERYGITSQLRRAAVSVATNIVEGCARRSKAEYVHFLGIAFASLREAGYLAGLAARLRYLDEASFQSLDEAYEECARVLAGLIKSLEKQK